MKPLCGTEVSHRMVIDGIVRCCDAREGCKYQVPITVTEGKYKMKVTYIRCTYEKGKNLC